MALTIAINDQNTEISLPEILESVTISSSRSSPTSDSSTSPRHATRLETQNVRAKASNRKRNKMRQIALDRNITIPVDSDWYGLDQSSDDSSEYQDEDKNFSQSLVSVKQKQEEKSIRFEDRSHYLVNVNKLRFEILDTFLPSLSSSKHYQSLTSKMKFFYETPRSKIPVRIKKLPYSDMKTNPIREQIEPNLGYFSRDLEVSNTLINFLFGPI